MKRIMVRLVIDYDGGGCELVDVPLDIFACAFQTSDMHGLRPRDDAYDVLKSMMQRSTSPREK